MTRSRNQNNRKQQNARGTKKQNSVTQAASMPVMRQPLYKPIVTFRRTVQSSSFDIVCDGINPTIGVINFSLNDVPNSTEFSTLFQMWKIQSVSCTFRPEYTELTDAALVSNAVNVNFNSAVDPFGSTPTSVNDVLQFQNCKSTGITKVHSRLVKPTLLMDGTSPCDCFVSTTSPALNFWSFVYGIPPTGIAMTFRSTLIYGIVLAGAR